MSLHSCNSFLAALCLVLACGPVTETIEDTDTEPGTTGTSDPATSASTSPTPTTSSETTSEAPDTTTGEPHVPDESSSEDSGFIGRPDAGVSPPPGICVGLTEVGFLGTVSRRTDAAVDPTCAPEPASCGGDLVGTWTIESDCGLEALPNFFAETCPESTMTFIDSVVAGTRTFAEDGSYASDAMLQFDLHLDIDAMDCFGIDCATLGVALDGENNLDAVCDDAPEGSGCACLLTITNDLTVQGTWSVEGDAVTLTFDGEASDPRPFCVQGDRLALWEGLHESRAYPETACADASDCADALGDAHDEWLCVE